MEADDPAAYDVYRRLYIDDAFENLTVDAISTADVARWFAATTRISGPGGAIQCMTILNTMMVKAEAWGYRPEGSNPLEGIRWNKRRKCERFLSVPELERLGASLRRVRAGEDATDARAAAALTLLALTGCRKSEVLNMQWPDVPGNRLRLRDGKTGGRTVWLGNDARALIDTLPKPNGSSQRGLSPRPKASPSPPACSILAGHKFATPLIFAAFVFMICDTRLPAMRQ